MVEEKNSILSYLACSPEEASKTVFREMKSDQSVEDYSFQNTIQATYNFAQYLKTEEFGENIPLFLETSTDFLRSFFGVLAANKVNVPIHTTATEDTIEFILKKIRAKSIVVMDLWLYKKLVQLDYVKENIHTIFTTAEIIGKKSLPSQHVDIQKIFEKEVDFTKANQFLKDTGNQMDPDSPMQIVFTSGTTGDPKGAVLSHRNVVSCVIALVEHLKVDSSYRTLTFLPLSHVMGQNEVFIAMVCRSVVQIVGRDNLLHGLKVLKPNILVSVPRVYEAIYQGIQRKLRAKPLFKKLLLFSVDMYTQGIKDKSFFSRMVKKLYHFAIGRTVGSMIRKNLGKFRLLITAGAACPEHIYYFFGCLGMPLTNAQGLTEVSGAVIYNKAGETLRGSIGYPTRVDVKIDQDGEILMKGDPVFGGYFEDPIANANSFTNDGWFRTGDLGRIEKIRNKPYIFLEGRKKEIVVLASGENITPIQIEEKLLQHDIIHQVVIVGDGQPRLSALIVPNTDDNNHNLRDEVSKVIQQVNTQMNVTEKISGFELLTEPFTVENGLLTPTMKMKRPAIFKHYEGLIGNLYNTSA